MRPSNHIYVDRTPTLLMTAYSSEMISRIPSYRKFHHTNTFTLRSFPSPRLHKEPLISSYSTVPRAHLSATLTLTRRPPRPLVEISIQASNHVTRPFTSWRGAAAVQRAPSPKVTPGHPVSTDADPGSPLRAGRALVAQG